MLYGFTKVTIAEKRNSSNDFTAMISLFSCLIVHDN